METSFLSFFVVKLKQIHIDKGITAGYSTNILQCLSLPRVALCATPSPATPPTKWQGIDGAACCQHVSFVSNSIACIMTYAVAGYSRLSFVVGKQSQMKVTWEWLKEWLTTGQWIGIPFHLFSIVHLVISTQWQLDSHRNFSLATSQTFWSLYYAPLFQCQLRLQKRKLWLNHIEGQEQNRRKKGNYKGGQQESKMTSFSNIYQNIKPSKLLASSMHFGLCR